MSALEDLVRSIVREELARALEQLGDRAGQYSSTSLPPDVTNRATFARLARRCPRAVLVGKTWIVPRDAWVQFRNARAATKPKRASRDEQTGRFEMETEADVTQRSGLRVVVGGKD